MYPECLDRWWSGSYGRVVPGPLTDDEITGFVENGFVILRNGFDRRDAEEARAFLWGRISAQPTDPKTWTEPVVHLEETFGQGPFARVYTKRLCEAVDQLVGAGRWRWMDDPGSPPEVGWFAVAFPGFDRPPYELPALEQWHMDINGAELRVHLRLNHEDPRPQALVVIPLFSDIAPRGGGTVLWVGSHRVAAGLLARAEPTGILPAELMVLTRQTLRSEVVEVNGAAGDVALLHGWLLHARGAHLGHEPRFIANCSVRLTTPLDLDGPSQTPLERSVVAGLPYR
jgi:hypothetical protein